MLVSSKRRFCVAGGVALCLLLFGPARALLAQQRTAADSLLQRRASERADPARLRKRWKRSTENVDAHPEQAVQHAQEALRLARRLGSEEKVASSLQTLGNIYQAQGRLERALTYQQRARKAAEAAGNEEGAARALGNAANIYSTQGKLPKALRYYLRAMKRFEQADARRAVATCLNNIGLVHQQQGNMKKSLDYYDRAARMYEAAGDSVGLARVLNNKAVVFIERGAFGEALRHSRRALRLYETQGSQQGIASAHNNVGVALNRQGHPSEALRHLKKAARQSKRQGEKRTLAYTYDEMGRAYRKLDRLEEALTYARRGLRLAEKMGVAEALKATRRTVAAIYASRGNYERAYRFHQQYSAARDSVFSEKRASLIAQMQARYEMEQKEQHIENLEQKTRIQDLEAQRRRQTRKGLMAGLVLVLLLAGVLYNRYRLKRKANRLLQKRKERIQESLEEKELLVKEIHHRVKNNLQVMASLLNLQTERLADPSALGAVRDMQSRVQAMAMVHQRLYGADNLARVKVQSYFEELSGFVLQAFESEVGAVECQVEVEEVALRLDTAMPLGLILSELLSNALKHAFPDERGGWIEVSLREIGAATYEMKVSDNGVGLSAPARPPDSDTLGLTLVEDLTYQLDGALELTNGVGLTCAVRFEEKEPATA